LKHQLQPSNATLLTFCAVFTSIHFANKTTGRQTQESVH
jgi:hypothetical protein